MAATWTVVSMDRYTTKSSKADVVYNLHWACADTETISEVDYNGRTYGSVGIQTDSLSPFTAYANITAAKALEWVKAELGADEVTAQEAGVQAQIDEAKTPSVKTGIPWD